MQTTPTGKLLPWTCLTAPEGTLRTVNAAATACIGARPATACTGVRPCAPSARGAPWGVPTEGEGVTVGEKQKMFQGSKSRQFGQETHACITGCKEYVSYVAPRCCPFIFTASADHCWTPFSLSNITTSDIVFEPLCCRCCRTYSSIGASPRQNSAAANFDMPPCLGASSTADMAAAAMPPSPPHSDRLRLLHASTAAGSGSKAPQQQHASPPGGGSPTISRAASMSVASHASMLASR